LAKRVVGLMMRQGRDGVHALPPEVAAHLRFDTMHPLDIPNEEFRSLAARIAGLAADFLRELPDLRTFPAVSGKQTTAAFDEPLPERGLGARALEALEGVLAMARPPSPRFFGYVLGSGDPVAALADLLASVLNQNITSWRSSPAGVTIERQVVQWIAEA